MSDAADLVGLAESLRALLPPEALSFDVGGEYEVDGLTPFVVTMPRTQQEVSAVLRASTDAGAAVLPRGAGTQLSLGMPPERYDVALDLAKLERVFEHESADLTVTVGAGHSWAAMQASLAEHGQWVPLDPVLDEGATVGGILATNASGPARIRYGTARDLVIGMTVALANGEIIKSGGRVVKNVAGYDMAKLHIGALGTLGVILQASFKVSPLAESESFSGAWGTLEEMFSLADRTLGSRLPILGLNVFWDGEAPDWKMAVRLAGGEAAVSRANSEFRTLAGPAFDPGAYMWPISFIGQAGEKTLAEAGKPVAQIAPRRIRFTCPPAGVGDLCRALSTMQSGVTALPGIGAVYCTWHDQKPTIEELANLRSIAIAAGGALVLEAAPVELKRAVGVWGQPRGDFALMQRLKQQFDPARTLNPGRFVGGI